MKQKFLFIFIIMVNICVFISASSCFAQNFEKEFKKEIISADFCSEPKDFKHNLDNITIKLGVDLVSDDDTSYQFLCFPSKPSKLLPTIKKIIKLQQASKVTPIGEVDYKIHHYSIKPFKKDHMCLNFDGKVNSEDLGKFFMKGSCIMSDHNVYALITLSLKKPRLKPLHKHFVSSFTITKKKPKKKK